MTSTDMPSRIAMPCPFGSKGTLGTIDNTSSTNMNYPDGFPTIYGAPSSSSGKFVSRGEMNRLGNIATNDMFYQKCGGLNTFDIQLAHFIGGYPKGAILDYLVGQKLYKIESLIENNLNDPTGNGGTGTFSDVTAGSVDGISWRFLNQDEPNGENEYQYDLGSLVVPAFSPTYTLISSDTTEQFFPDGGTSYVVRYPTTTIQNEIAALCGIVSVPVTGYLSIYEGDLPIATKDMPTPGDANIENEVNCIYNYAIMAKTITDLGTTIQLPTLTSNNGWYGITGLNNHVMSISGKRKHNKTTVLSTTTNWDSADTIFYANKDTRVAICLVCGMSIFPTQTFDISAEGGSYTITSSSSIKLMITKI